MSLTCPVNIKNVWDEYKAPTATRIAHRMTNTKIVTSACSSSLDGPTINAHITWLGAGNDCRSTIAEGSPLPRKLGLVAWVSTNASDPTAEAGPRRAPAPPASGEAFECNPNARDLA